MLNCGSSLSRLEVIYGFENMLGNWNDYHIPEVNTGKEDWLKQSRNDCRCERVERGDFDAMKRA